MNLLTIAWKSIRQRSLASVLTALSVALGVALMIAVLVINGVITRMFSQSGSGYNLVVGPQGSATDLVLSTVYRTQLPANNLPWRYYTEFVKRREVETAIPLTMGDFTEEGGFPIVGTVPRYFAIPYGHGKESGFIPQLKELLGIAKRPVVPQHFRIGTDEILAADFDAVIGSEVARKNGWDVGSSSSLVHGGLASEDAHVHDEKFTVRGVLAPTGTANDRSVFVHLDGFFMISGHDKPIDEAVERLATFYQVPVETVEEWYADDIAHAKEDEAGGHDHAHHHHVTPDLQKEVSAILVITRTDPAAILLASDLAEGVQAQGSQPGAGHATADGQSGRQHPPGADVSDGPDHSGLRHRHLREHLQLDGRPQTRDRHHAGSGGQSANRLLGHSVRVDPAVRRRRLVGLILGHGLVYIASPIVAARSGLLIDPYHFERVELLLFPILIAMASLVGFLPGLTAYRTDVAKALYD